MQPASRGNAPECSVSYLPQFIFTCKKKTKSAHKRQIFKLQKNKTNTLCVTGECMELIIGVFTASLFPPEAKK